MRVVDRIGLPISPNPENLRYLQTKRDRMGHDLPGLGNFEGSPT
jgi:3,4-dihydroxy 2-butanone 4-phosphate synthase/GTP cyclohydrolase II